MRKNVPQIKFFDWYYKHVTIPFINTVRAWYNRRSPKSNESNNTDLGILPWGDLDIPYLQQLKDHDRMKDSFDHGVYPAKIGVNITEILKTCACICTTKDRDKPLTICVKANF